MTVDTRRPSSVDRDPDLVLARAHLRLGSFGLARAELETLAGRNLLDDDGIRDLAEARWRTGDLTGAGEAAAAYLEVEARDVVALVIAAEAQADLGRPAEARRLAGQAMDRANGSLDPVFAGMKRSSIWPVEPGTPLGPEGVLFDDLHPGPVAPGGSGATYGRRATDRHGDRQRDDSTHAPLDPAVPSEIGAAPGLWGDDPDAGSSVAGTPPEPQSLLDGAREALERGEIATAATGLILVLRSSPRLAPAVLDLVNARSEPALVLVRGDAQRVVGREREAMRDHAAVARVIADSTTAATATPDVPAEAVDLAKMPTRSEPADPPNRTTPVPDQEDS
jgi:hypothetical protein